MIDRYTPLSDNIQPGGVFVILDNVNDMYPRS